MITDHTQQIALVHIITQHIHLRDVYLCCSSRCKKNTPMSFTGIIPQLQNVDIKLCTFYLWSPIEKTSQSSWSRRIIKRAQIFKRNSTQARERERKKGEYIAEPDHTHTSPLLFCLSVSSLLSVYLSLWTSNNLWKGITERNSTPRWTELDLRNCLKKLKLDFTRKLENLDLRQTPFFLSFFLLLGVCWWRWFWQDI